MSQVGASGKPGAVQLTRLFDLTEGSATTRFGYDGHSIIAEYSSANAVQRRFVRGAGIDEVLVWYEGSDTSDRRYLHADERGSIVAITNSSGAVTNVNSYDEYGIPAAANVGRFQYTGQPWLSAAMEYYYRARMYNPNLGRFMQTDPIGFGGGLNIYAYVQNDPVTFRDPTGLQIGSAYGCQGNCPQIFGIGGVNSGQPGEAQDSRRSHIERVIYQGGASSGGSGEIVVTGMRLHVSVLNLEMGAFGNAISEFEPGACVYWRLCPNRRLTRSELNFYEGRGLPRVPISGTVLVSGMPVGIFYGSNASGYAVPGMIFLRGGIGSALSSPERAGLVGEELYHIWQYSQGATPELFAYYWAKYGHDNSPLEVPAMRFNRQIVQCRSLRQC